MLAAFLGRLHGGLLLADAILEHHRHDVVDRGPPPTAASAPGPTGASFRRPNGASAACGGRCGSIHAATLVFLLVFGLGPLLWLAKSSITPTQDTLRTPMALWPHGFDLGYFGRAWTQTHIDRYFLNTILIAAGSWFVQVVVATTAGFALSVLRPRFSRHPDRPGARHAVRARDRPARAAVPDGRRHAAGPRLDDRQRSGRCGCRPGQAPSTSSSMKRFFDNLPREIFEAAQVDGAGPFRLFWSVVLPMSRPIIGVVSVFAVIATWKDYLWPLLVLRNPAIQPLSVRLPDPPADDRARHLPRGPGHGDADPDRHLPGLPADVPQRRRAERRAEGLRQRPRRVRPDGRHGPSGVARRLRPPAQPGSGPAAVDSVAPIQATSGSLPSRGSAPQAA